MPSAGILLLKACLNWANYRGLTHEAYAPDLRQFTGWRRARSVPVFSIRRGDIEVSIRGQPRFGKRGSGRSVDFAECVPRSA